MRVHKITASQSCISSHHGVGAYDRTGAENNIIFDDRISTDFNIIGKLGAWLYGGGPQ